MTTELSNEKISLLGVNSLSNTKDHTALIKLSVEVPNATKLSKLISRLRNISDVIDVSRH
jgi:GTP pyrophosphokinase